MPQPRAVQFNTVSDLISDVEQLQRGCVSAKNWSLPQTAWHCGTALKALQPVPPGTQSTPEQVEQKKARIDPLLAAGEMPDGLPTPPGTDPLTEAPPLDASAVDAFISELKRLNAATQPLVAFSFVGLVTLDEFKRFILIHSTHHLKNLIPTT